MLPPSKRHPFRELMEETQKKAVCALNFALSIKYADREVEKTVVGLR